MRPSHLSPSRLALTSLPPLSEGQVFFSEQGAAFADGDAAALSAPVALRKFTDFLRNFRSEPTPGRKDGETVYRDRLDALSCGRGDEAGGGGGAEAQRRGSVLTVHLEDLIAHDAELADMLRRRPGVYVPLVRPPRAYRRRRAPYRAGAVNPLSAATHARAQLETACGEVLHSLRNEVVLGEETAPPSVQVFLVSSQVATPIRELSVRPLSPLSPPHLVTHASAPP